MTTNGYDITKYNGRYFVYDGVVCLGSWKFYKDALAITK